MIKAKKVLAVILAAGLCMTSVPDNTFASQQDVTEQTAQPSQTTSETTEGTQQTASAQADTTQTDTSQAAATQTDTSQAATTQADTTAVVTPSETVSTETTGTETKVTETAGTETTETETSAQSDDQASAPMARALMQTEAAQSNATESYIQLLAGSGNEHDDSVQSGAYDDYKFIPAASGWYHLVYGSDNEISLSEYITYYTDDGNNGLKENTGNNCLANSGKSKDLLFYAKTGNEYHFSINGLSGSKANYWIGVYTAEIQSMSIQGTMDNNVYSSIDFTGLSLVINYTGEGVTNGDPVSTVSPITASGEVSAFDLASCSQYDYNDSAYIYRWINSNIIYKDAQDHSIDLNSAADGDYTWNTVVSLSANGTSQDYPISSGFTLARNEIETISDLTPEITEYTKGVDSNLSIQGQNYKFKVNYSAASGKTAVTKTLSGYNSDISVYTKDEQENHVPVSSVDAYLKDHSDATEMTVFLSYRGVETSYQVSILNSKYTQISAELNTTTFYANAGTDVYINYSMLKSLALSTADGTVTYSSNPQNSSVENICNLPSYSNIEVGFEKKAEDGTVQLYQNLQAFLDNGGSTGENTVKVSYGGVSTEITVNIVENPYTSIEVTAPSKTEYIHNMTADLNLTGLKIKAVKADGSYDMYSYDDYMAQISDSATAFFWQNYFSRSLGGHEDVKYLEIGTHTVNITFMGLKGSYDITVTDSPITNLSISAYPARIKMAAGTNFGINYTGLKLNFSLNKTVFTDIDVNSSEMYSLLAPYNAGVSFDTNDVNFDKEGTYPVSVSILGASISYNVQVVEKPVQNLEISHQPTKVTYVKGISSNLDTNGMKVSFDLDSVHYSDIDPYSILWSSIFSNYVSFMSISDKDVDFTKVGDYQVDVNVLGAAAQYTIHVVPAPISNITLAKVPIQKKIIKSMNYGLSYSGLQINYTDTATGIQYTNIDIGSSQLTSLFNTYGFPQYKCYPDLSTTGTKAVSLNILGTELNYSLEVIDSPISNFKIKTLPTKTEGLIGNSSWVSLEGMKVSFDYDGESYQDIDYNSTQLTTMFSAYGFTGITYNSLNVNWQKEAYYPITVSLLGATATYEYHVISSPITDLQITKLPTATTLIKNSGNSLSLSGMKVSFKLGTTQYTDLDVYSSKMYTLSHDYGTYVGYTTPADFDQSKNNTYKFKVNILGSTVDIDVTVADSPISEVSIARLPDHTQMIKNTYPWISYSGLRLNYTYQGVNYKNIDVYSASFNRILGAYNTGISPDNSSIDRTKTGSYDMTLRFLGTSVTYKIDVVEVPITNLKISSEPLKLKYATGTAQHINMYGLKVSFDYNGATYKDLSPYADEIQKIGNLYNCDLFSYDASAVNFNLAGSYKVKVSLLGCTAEYTVQVVNEAIKELKIINGPTETAYAGYSKYISIDGMEVQVTEMDGTSVKYLAYTNDKAGYGNWDFLEDDLSWDESSIQWDKSGNYSIPVTYNGKTASFQYEVKENPVDYISIEQMPVKTTYLDKVYEDTTLKGLECTIHYKNASTADTKIQVTDDRSSIKVENGKYLTAYNWKSYMDDNEEEPSLGENALILNYLGVTTEIPVTVIENPVKSITCIKNPEKNYAFCNTSIDMYGAQFLITYQDNTTQQIECSEHYTLPVVNNLDEGLYKMMSTAEYQSDDNTIRFGVARIYGSVSLDKMDFTKINTSVIKDGDVIPVKSNSNNRYFCYKFIPEETKSYHFYTLGDWETLGAVYDEQGTLIDSYNGDDEGNLALDEPLTAGKTYYLATMLYSPDQLKADRCFTVCLSSSSYDDSIAANKILQSKLIMAVPAAGQSLADAIIADADSNYTVSTSWSNDSGSDKIADYATAQKAVVTIHPVSGYSFIEGAAVTLNGKTMQTYKLSDGSLRFAYTFPYTDCKVTLPSVTGYTFNGDTTAAYGSDYTFTYAKADGVTADLLVKAGDEILTPDAKGKYSMINLKTSVVVTAKVIQQTVTANRTLLQFFDKTSLKDTISALTGKTVATNDKEKALPVLESYTDSSNQFFFGWFANKDSNNNGTGTRFTSKSVVPATNPSSYYAKWGQGIFTYTYNGKTVHYKILSIDENNKIKVQVGDGANPAISADSVDNTGAIDATGITDGVIIPSDFSNLSQLSAELGVSLSGCSVTAIADNAFSGLTAISSVTLPDTIQTVGEGAFSGCTNLTSLNLGAGTLSLGANVFNGCSSLTTLTIPGTLTSVDSAAFSGLPASVTISCDADSASVLQDAIDAAGAGISLVTHSLSLDYNSSSKNFTYGDNGFTITASDQLSSGTASLTWSGDSGINTYYTLAINNAAGTIQITPKKATNKSYQITVTDGVVSKSVTLTTAAASLSSKAAIANIADVTANGSPLKPSVSIKLSSSGAALAEGTDYTLAYTNNTNAGTATVTATGIGNYSGTLTKTFTIKAAAAAPSGNSGTTGGTTPTTPSTPATTPATTEPTVKTMSVSDYTQTFKKKGTFQITVKNAEGTATYSSSNQKVATVDNNGKVSMKGLGKTVITITATNGSVTSTVWLVPSKNAVKSLKSSAKKKINISWKKDTTATGYSIEISKTSDFSSDVTEKVVSKNKTTSATISKLTSKTTYYVRIRSYIKSGSEKGYSEYSAVKKVKVK